MKQKLSVWRAACIITGYGVGTGVMALPYLVERAGFIPGLLIVVLAFLFNYALHLMLAEITLKSPRGAQIITVFRTHLFRGRYASYILGALFVLIVVVLETNLAAYVAGGAEILQGAGLPALPSQLIFYGVAAIVVLFGLTLLGLSESVCISLIIILVGLLTIASLFAWHNPLPLTHLGHANELLAVFGMAMFSFVAFFSIPQAVEGLNRNPQKIRRAILLGLGLNLIFIIAIVTCALASSASVTPLAMIGWAKGMGGWAEIVGSLFTLLALLSTYWSLSLALCHIIEEQTKLSHRISWIIATLPSLILVVLNVGGFLSIMRTAGGLIAILMALLVIPAFRRVRHKGSLQLIPALAASTPLQLIVFVAFLLMAVGSAVSL